MNVGKGIYYGITGTIIMVLIVGVILGALALGVYRKYIKPVEKVIEMVEIVDDKSGEVISITKENYDSLMKWKNNAVDNIKNMSSVEYLQYYDSVKALFPDKIEINFSTKKD